MNHTLGPTGTFPRGKVHDDDEGAIKIGVAADHEHGIVVMNFGVGCQWIGLPPIEAKDFALMILRKAQEIEQAGNVRTPPS